MTTSSNHLDLAACELVCFSHLRWDFVYQRPQHLLSRCAKQRRVTFWEEPIYTEVTEPVLAVSQRNHGLRIAVPTLPQGTTMLAAEEMQRELLDRFLDEENVREFVSWYYSPMAVAFSKHLRPATVIYDCMDELSAFKGASPLLKEREAELFRMAELVFTGGRSLYESKRKQHGRVYAFPSSIDAQHFARARKAHGEPADQAGIAHPRIGFYGVLDERLDLELIRELAAMRPEWHIVLIGPVVKISAEELPVAPNIHYLGGKSYEELPEYVAGWDVAALFFAMNDSTRFISPTKTPEYLAAGKPVVSTPIADVVSPYGESGMVRIAADAKQFAAAVEASLKPQTDEWRAQVEAHLAQTSWDMTWSSMWGLVEGALERPTTTVDELVEIPAD